MVVHRGGCHCGATRFEVDTPAQIGATLFNCSICSMTSYLHLIVLRSRSRLLRAMTCSKMVDRSYTSQSLIEPTRTGGSKLRPPAQQRANEKCGTYSSCAAAGNGRQF